MKNYYSVTVTIPKFPIDQSEIDDCLQRKEAGKDLVSVETEEDVVYALVEDELKRLSSYAYIQTIKDPDHA